MSEEFDAVEQAIWEEENGRYFDDPDDYWYEDDEEDLYSVGFDDGYAAGYDAAMNTNLITRLKAFMQRWWINRRMRQYMLDADDIPF